MEDGCGADKLTIERHVTGGNGGCYLLGGGEGRGPLGGAEKQKIVSFHMKGGSEGTLPDSRNAPFRAWGGSQGGEGYPHHMPRPPSIYLTAVPGEGLSRGEFEHLRRPDVGVKW